MRHAAPSLLPPGPPRALEPGELDALVAAERGRRHGCVLIDARPTTRDELPADHVAGSARLLWPAEGVPPTMLLPPRGHSVVVVSEPRLARDLAARLEAAGWPAWWNAAPVRRSWLDPGPAHGALWDVDPYLREQLVHFGELPPGPVLDLGCGSSREGVFLAQLGYDVVGVDRLPDALSLAEARAAHHGVRIRTVQARVRRVDDLPAGPFAAVLLFRFAERGVLAGLGRSMAPGGLALLRAYARVHDATDEDSPGTTSGPRRTRFRLRPDEVQRLLGPGWTFVDGPQVFAVEGTSWTAACARWIG